MASKTICSRLQKLEAEISVLVEQHLRNFQKERDARAENYQEYYDNIEHKRSSSEPIRGKQNEQLAICIDDNLIASYPSSRQTSPDRSNPQKRTSLKKTSIIKTQINDNISKCNHNTKGLCKCCQKKSVQFSNSPRKSYTVEELFKIPGRLSSTSQRNPSIYECAPRINIEDEILDDTVNIQTTLFQMPNIKEAFKSFDPNTLLSEKLQALEDENKRLTAALENEARLRKTFMEEAKREIKRTEEMMDEKITNMQKQAMESIQQVAVINNNLTVALENKEETLKRINTVAAKLKIEQERDKCKCKLATNVCKKLKERNDELEKEKKKIVEDIERVKADNERLKGDLMECKNQIDLLSNELKFLRKQKEALKNSYYKTIRKAESQMTDLRKKHEIEAELDKLTNVLKQTEEERERLNCLVAELKETLVSQKERIENLIRINEEQEVVLKSQKAALDSKEEQIRLYEAETTIIKQNSFVLEQKLSFAEDSLKAAKDYSIELEKARQEIAELKDIILLKESIINDQTETLITLKKENEKNAGHINRLRKDIETKNMEIEKYKSDCEAQTKALQNAQQEATLIATEFRKVTMKTSESITKLKKMSVELGSQNVQNQALLQDIATLKQENEDLHNKVEELQQKLENVCHYSSAGDMERQQLLITYLEQQVALQQREWEIQKRVINKEKSKALQTAKFATKKLLETVQDFQKQTEMQRRVHVMLTNMLQEKEEKLHKITSKMGTSAKSTLPKIEECVNEVCTKEYRVPVVRRSIYSPHSDVTIGDLSDNENSDNEDDEESLEVPSATRLLPKQNDTFYGHKSKENENQHNLPSTYGEDESPENSSLCCSSKRHSKRCH